MAENDRILDAGERMRRGACGDGPGVVLVQVAAADAVEMHAQLHFTWARKWLWNFFETDVLPAVVDRGAHQSRNMARVVAKARVVSSSSGQARCALLSTSMPQGPA